MPVELFVTGTDIFGKNFGGTGIFHATCFLAFKDIVYSMPRGAVGATATVATCRRGNAAMTVATFPYNVATLSSRRNHDDSRRKSRHGNVKCDVTRSSAYVLFVHYY